MQNAEKKLPKEYGSAMHNVHSEWFKWGHNTERVFHWKLRTRHILSIAGAGGSQKHLVEHFSNIENLIKFPPETWQFFSWKWNWLVIENVFHLIKPFNDPIMVRITWIYNGKYLWIPWTEYFEFDTWNEQSILRMDLKTRWNHNSNIFYVYCLMNNIYNSIIKFEFWNCW